MTLDLEDISEVDIVFCVMLYCLFTWYIHSLFGTLHKVVEQSIGEEMNNHKRILAMFNSLQEGIVIV